MRLGGWDSVLLLVTRMTTRWSAVSLAGFCSTGSVTPLARWSQAGCASSLVQVHNQSQTGTTCYLCTTQPAAPSCWGFSGPGCRPGAPPNWVSSQGSAVLGRSRGVFCFLWCSYPTFWIGEIERRKTEAGLSSPASLCMPAHWHCSRKPGVPRLILESFLILSHAQNTTLCYSNSVFLEHETSAPQQVQRDTDCLAWVSHHQSETIGCPNAVTALPISSPTVIIVWLLMMVISALEPFLGAETEPRPEQLCLKLKSEKSLQMWSVTCFSCKIIQQFCWQLECTGTCALTLQHWAR